MVMTERRRMMARLWLQTSVMMLARSKGPPTLKSNKMGSWNLPHPQRGLSSPREGSVQLCHGEGVALGFELSWLKIQSNPDTIYRGSCLRISHMNRTLSPSRIQFKIDPIWSGFDGGKISSVALFMIPV
jgi:hypothetical protein